MNIEQTSRGMKASQENDYGKAIVKTNRDGNIVLIKNSRNVGTFMADNKGLFRQRDNQEILEVSDFDTGIEIAKLWMSEITEQCDAGLKSAVEKFQQVASEKNYKPGWVFFQTKECYGQTLAEKFAGK